MSDYTFPDPYTASQAADYLNSLPGNFGNVICYRVGCRVWLRPEYVSARTMKTLKELSIDLV